MKKRFDPNSLLNDVSSKYGAPMGRNNITENATAKVHLFCVRFVDGDYDVGGAYWGGGWGTTPLYAAIGDGFRYFLRAGNRESVKQHLKLAFPELKFYR